MQLELVLPLVGAAFATALLALVASKAAAAVWRMLVMLVRGIWWLTMGWWIRQLWLRFVA